MLNYMQNRYDNMIKDMLSNRALRAIRKSLKESLLHHPTEKLMSRKTRLPMMNEQHLHSKVQTKILT